ncbi:Ankyrin-2 [Chionoecetes opilio]|uniref:Ankyrin-2 n=1 Tax=Chionoecetes opilio TaxID=41210 RepID=A0A8J5CM86_CHIOP|nr:Ankyrin-2 [Chionoecetes opilio]
MWASAVGVFRKRSLKGGTTRAQWEDVTGSTPLTFVNDCVSFTTTVSARFWLMDCSNIPEATKMATELYREAIHVPFMAKFVVFSKRHQLEEARVRVFCMTDDREDKTLEHQENFIEVSPWSPWHDCITLGGWGLNSIKIEIVLNPLRPRT